MILIKCLRLTLAKPRVFGEPRREVDDLDQSASLDFSEAPRRSTSSLEPHGVSREGGTALPQRAPRRP
jgi:hypothetical protein